MAQQITMVTQKGQVTIPSPIRKALNIKPKDRVVFDLVDGEVRLRAIKSRLLAGFGAVKPPSKPIDFEKLRHAVEEEIAEEVVNEG